MSHTGVNPKHVFMGLSKNMCALFEESNEILLYLPPHSRLNPSKLLWVGLVQRYIFQYLNWLSQCSPFRNVHCLHLLIHSQHC